MMLYYRRPSSSSSMSRYHHHHRQVRPAPPPSMRSAPSVAVAHSETMKEIAPSGTSDPKIRRNALHAYISYMIYTDLIGHHKRASVALTKNERSSPTAFDKVPPTTSTSSFERPMSMPNHHSSPDNIIHRPLTAFLRDPDPRNGNRPRSYTSIPLLPSYTTSRNPHH
ncbi:hypothetical protein LRAMOSA07231 [Lichtheimia ramosa]|uniref:Uncharacterized protein n=1 Tax=Lichtheimia ramosa TaxID=688394 RepID=A0A077WAB5_9FUNG|nr:hypothetical protein LRAMOSA07231 [Lichtheimia ramosa]